jgi:ABC-type branched-subunit amino acid transport system ATPase component
MAGAPGAANAVLWLAGQDLDYRRLNQPSIIDQIRNIRDTALAALKSSIDAVAKKIELATSPDEAALNQRLDDLMNQRAAIETAVTDAALALPEVIAAAAALNTLAAQMKTTAQQLLAVTNVLTTTATVLALGEQFSGALANAR